MRTQRGMRRSDVSANCELERRYRTAFRHRVKTLQHGYLFRICIMRLLVRVCKD